MAKKYLKYMQDKDGIKLKKWKEEVFLFIISLLATLFIEIFRQTPFQDILCILITTVILFILINIPYHIIKEEKERMKYLVNTLDEYKDVIKKSLSRIDEHIPPLTALITDEESFEKKLGAMKNLPLSGGGRWIYSIYISTLLSKSFKPFTIKMTAFEYSIFSSTLFIECKESIYLTGSMRPSTWLNSLVKIEGERNPNKKKRKDFFNNSLRLEEFRDILDKNNHSITLIEKCPLIKNEKKFRVVCLEKYDIDYLFLSERSIDAYYCVNDPTKIPNSYFYEYSPPPRRNSIMNPMEYEYALYDSQLLLRYDKKRELLYLNSGEIGDQDKEEFKEVNQFFIDQISKTKNGDKKDLLGYEEIKRTVRETKIEVLNTIITNNKLPHKLSYLYSGGIRWNKYINKETKYKKNATEAIRAGLTVFKKNLYGKEEHIEIVEIGAGSGERISTICDTLSSRIKSYELLDISKSLLDKANEVLFERMPNLSKIILEEEREEREKRQKENKILLDCCNEESYDELIEKITNKHVFIPNNSTLFTEDGFKWDNFRPAKSIFITLDLYELKIKEEEENKTLNDHLKAKHLFLNPLRIFEIPIDNIDEKLFSPSYDKNEHKFNIIFNLKAYLENKGKPIEFGCLFEDKGDNTILAKSFVEYKEKREKLKKIDELIVLSSLKFEYIKGKENETKQIIIDYFKRKKFDAKIHLSNFDDDHFASILLTPK